MSDFNGSHIQSGTATAAITYARFVKSGTTAEGTVKYTAAGANEKAVGVCARAAAAAGDAVSVAHFGVGLIEVDGSSTNIAAGDALAPSANGVGIKAEDGDYAAAIALEPATAANVQIKALITPAGGHRDSLWMQVGSDPKVGATAGWTVAAANDTGLMGTVAASQTAATLVVPLTNLHIGDVITGFGVNAQIESAGGAVTLDCALRKMTGADADYTDASVATMTQISVTADDSFNGVSTGTKTGISETVTAGVKYYMLLTATTAGSTDIALGGLTLQVSPR